MRTDSVPRWLGPTTSWRDALRQAAIIFIAFAGLHVLMWVLSLEPLERTKILQAALLGGWLGLLQRAAPPSKRLLRAVAPEQLRVTLSALLIATGFFGMGIVLGVGETGSILEDWPFLLGLSLLAGFVLAMVGALETSADGRVWRSRRRFTSRFPENPWPSRAAGR